MLPIDSIKKMELKPGDIIVLKTSRYVSNLEREALNEQVKKEFPNNKCILLQGGMDINVISPEELEGIKKGFLLSQKAEQA